MYIVYGRHKKREKSWKFLKLSEHKTLQQAKAKAKEHCKKYVAVHIKLERDVGWLHDDGSYHPEGRK